MFLDVQGTGKALKNCPYNGEKWYNCYFINERIIIPRHI